MEGVKQKHYGSSFSYPLVLQMDRVFIVPLPFFGEGVLCMMHHDGGLDQCYSKHAPAQLISFPSAKIESDFP